MNFSNDLSVDVYYYYLIVFVCGLIFTTKIINHYELKTDLEPRSPYPFSWPFFFFFFFFRTL